MRAYLWVSGVLFGVVALVHVLRIAYAWPVQIAGTTVPLEVSWIGLIVPGGLCVWAISLVRRAAP
jgi:hypothetical protein